MSVISWQFGKIEYVESENGAPKTGAPWKKIDVPKQDSVKIETSDGEEVSVKDENGDVVDRRTGKSAYTLEFSLFKKKGVALPFTDHDGRIDGEFAFRLVPDDPTCDGYQFDRTVVSAKHSFTTKEGAVITYTAKALKPKAGDACKLAVIS